ncbi:MAG: MBOAT family O-acyltransferase, partial [Planctomycetota bacterium]
LPLVLYFWWHPKLTTPIRLGILTAASYAFYGWWDFRFVGLLALSTLVDYWVGNKLYLATANSSKTRWLLVSMFSNLSLLAFFKYSGFFAESINTALDWFRFGGAIGAIPVPEILLPVGISFYTFQTMSYTIDIYRGKARPTTSIWHFASYVSLFPQLIAGPIVRYSAMDDQLRRLDSSIQWNRFAQGISFFVLGMCQKVLLADTIAGKVNPLFENYHHLQFAGAWFAMLGYTCQLYFDFCGYSNMAVGLGRMLGFEFPQNFDSPYKSANIAQFWRRWHMSLSFWLRDYLFIPLGGSRGGKVLTLRNLVIVMFLGGLWHGAGWTFVLWGLFHGGLLVGHSLLSQSKRIQVPAPLAIATTFLFVVLGWTLFRSTDLAMSGSLYASMFGLNGLEADLLGAMGGVKSVAILALLLTVIFFAPNIWQWMPKINLPYAVGLAILLVLCILRFDQESPFLYFQF